MNSEEASLSNEMAQTESFRQLYFLRLITAYFSSNYVKGISFGVLIQFLAEIELGTCCKDIIEPGIR